MKVKKIKMGLYLLMVMLGTILTTIIASENACFAADVGKQTGDQVEGSFPDISIIADFYYLHRTEVDEQIKDSTVVNFVDYANTPGVDDRGFNLRYTELAAGAMVRKGVELFGDINVTPSTAYVEEMYFNISLPSGLCLKGGRFLSEFGSVNSKHKHEQDFFDQPLLYWAVFGNKGLLENGAQINWKVPVPFQIKLGIEVLEGKNEISYGTEQFGSNNVTVAPTNSPNLLNGFINSNVFIGDIRLNWGFYFQYGTTRTNNNLESNSGQAIHGATSIMLGSLSIAYYLDSFRYISLTGEYLYRTTSGEFYEADNQVTNEFSYKRDNHGYYIQLIGKPLSYLKCGLRFGGILGSEKIGALVTETATIAARSSATPSGYFRASAMVETTVNSFFKVKLQYNYDKTKYQKVETANEISYYGLTNHEIIFQCEFSFGKHGEFSFKE